MKSREILIPDPTRPNCMRAVTVDDLRRDYRNAPGLKEIARAKRRAERAAAKKANR